MSAALSSLTLSQATPWVAPAGAVWLPYSAAPALTPRPVPSPLIVDARNFGTGHKR